MNFDRFSLIYPENVADEERYSESYRPDVDMFTLEEIGLLECLNLKSTDLADFLTMNPEVIRYRTETFKDMIDNEALTGMLVSLIPVLTDIIELRRLEADDGDTNSYLSSITEIELYISSVNILYKGLKEARSSLKSPAFIALADHVFELAESDYYRQLNDKLEELVKRVREIKSVTIGVNLNSQLRPEEAGVLSINSESFRSGDVLEKILRMDFKDNEYTCIASLVPFGKKQSENQKTALSLAFNSAINEVYKSSLRSWKKIVQMYVLENTDFLIGLMPEFEFLVKATRFQKKLLELGCPLSSPDIRPASERAFDAKGLYNPCVAIKIGGEVVDNDLCFDDQARIYVLSGPNRGGKSVITCATGLAQVMLQLGMYLPAKEISISPVDAIFTHFPTGADDTIDKGRLGEECARLGEIFDRISKYSLVLLDESLSSTGSYEASYIAAEVLAGLSRSGCRAIFSTHLHELGERIEDINALTAPDGGRIDTLVAGIESGKRSFKITRAKPDGRSYARDIAEKYGLTYDEILKKIENNN